MAPVGWGVSSRAFYVLFSLAVTAGIFAWLFGQVSPGEVSGLLRGADGRGLLAFLAGSLGASLFRTWRYAVLLGVSGYRPRRTALFLTVLVYNTFADILPARLGTAVYLYITTGRLGIPFGAASSSFALPFLFDLLALAPLLALAALGLGTGAGPPPWWLAAGGAALAGLTLAGLGVLPRAARAAAELAGAFRPAGRERREKWKSALLAAEGEMRLARAGGVYGKLFLLSLMVRLCKYAALYAFLWALVAPRGISLGAASLPRVFVGLVSAEMAAALPVSGLAGFGAYEGTWALVFRLLLFPPGLAASTGVAHHLFTQVYGYTLGAAALLLLLLPAFGRPRPGRDQ